MKLAAAFPGQGSQYSGMCHSLMEEFPIVQEVFEEASDVLNLDLQDLLLNGSLEELSLSEVAQPTVVTASYALYRVWEKQIGLVPFGAVGHSLGELSALIAAGALPFSDGVRLARERGRLMHRALQEKKGRAGIVVDIDVDTLTDIIESVRSHDYVTISGYNSPSQFIIAGHQTALLKVEDDVVEAGGEFIPFRMMPMKADAPYHSALMDYLKPEFEACLQHVTFSPTKFDVWSTVTGKIIEPADNLAAILAHQLVTPVYWNQVLEAIHEAGADLFVDIGPNQITRNLIRENTRLPQSLSFDDQADREQLSQLHIHA
ncbi:hypothetical protein BBG47_07520 [Paenibacillus sp. KS1]|uniref:ACP S-malonyltransferase n=1 Tax=Paenibacillus sp. KS1 TaxID=1849249 RepID=UPI00080645F2|nr:ACP S-malonyltransferase [Paenibacillus sp. KS1]OBY80241.1 hypothetical protein BBG47_07520 [Paenibacillus sp. KS1]